MANRFDEIKIDKNEVRKNKETPSSSTVNKPRTKEKSTIMTVSLPASKLEEYKQLCYELGTLPGTKTRELIFQYLRDNR